MDGAAACSARVTEYDLVVIGGGTAGQTVALAARETGASVALLDHVRPSDLEGATWPCFLGTCAAVGCVPKKLMHELATLSCSVRDAQSLWPDAYSAVSGVQVWERATHAVKQHLHRSAEAANRQLHAAGVRAYAHKARLLPNGVVRVCDAAGGACDVLRARKALVLATGTRPVVEPYASAVPPKTERSWNLLTSDEIFHLPKAPGCTLVIGGSYVAVEIATIVAGLGFPTTLMMRSVPLREFEDAAVEHVMKDLVCRCGVQLHTGTVPLAWEEDGQGWVKVTSTDGNCGSYNTVVLAIGREVDRTQGSLGSDLIRLGAVVDERGRLKTDAEDRVEGLDADTYALGDIASRWPELQSMAGAAARCFVARRFAAQAHAYVRGLVPVTVYAGLELASVGETARQARARIPGAYRVLEGTARPLALPMGREGGGDSAALCYAQIICDADRDHRVVGCHLAMPHAADAIQGVALAMNMGLTLRNWHDLVPVHPTDLESLFFNLQEKSRSGDDECSRADAGTAGHEPMQIEEACANC